MPSESEFKEKFKDMKVSELKDLIRKHNLHYVIKGYSTMKKEELLSTVVKHFSSKGMSMQEVMKPKEAEKKEEPKMVEKKEASKMAEKKGSKVTKPQIKEWAVKVSKSEPIKPKPKVKLIIKPTTKPTKKSINTYSKEDLESMAKSAKEEEISNKAKLKHLTEVELPRYIELIKIAVDKKQLTEREAKTAIKDWKKAHGL